MNQTTIPKLRPANNKARCDISVNVTAHGEGLLLHKTLRSIYAGIDFASERGVDIECNISLDKPTALTTKIINSLIQQYPERSVNVYIVDFGDVSQNRNFLIQKSRGTYISFFDGDDFFTQNYLYQAYTVASTHAEPAVYSPRYLIVFDGDHYLVEKKDSTNFVDISKNLYETNYYIGQSFVHKEIYKHIQYQPDSNGYGMEDWHFCCEATASGFKFYNVPETIFFYRRKKTGSLLSSHLGSAAVIRPSRLFRPEVFSALPSSPVRQQPPAEAADRSWKNSSKHAVVQQLQRYELTYHYSKVQYTLHRNILAALGRRLRDRKASEGPVTVIESPVPQRLRAIGFSPELIHFWGLLNQYEPMIRSSADMLQFIPIVGYPEISAISNYYYRFCSQNSKRSFTDFVLVPHISTGGADLAAINLVKKLSRSSNGHVLVMTTIDVESSWLKQVSKLNNVVCIESIKELSGISDDHRTGLMLRLIQNWGIQRLSIINAELGYKLVTTYHRAIRDVGCTTYLHTFAFNMTDDGYLFNWIPNGLVDAYVGVDYYVTDSAAYKQQLQEINGFDENKVKVLYSPIEPTVQKKSDYRVKRRVMWASRICDDKLVDVMLEVGRELADTDIQLDVYGSLDKNYLDNGRFVNLIQPLSNVTYKGSYEGFGALPTNDYDMFLLTTKNEGMPFVILEACYANIYVVTAAVGGIPECIEQGINGSLITDKFNPAAYARAVIEAYEQGLCSNGTVIAAANTRPINRHSQEEYDRTVEVLMEL